MILIFQHLITVALLQACVSTRTINKISALYTLYYPLKGGGITSAQGYSLLLASYRHNKMMFRPHNMRHAMAFYKMASQKNQLEHCTP